jgi:hypothetical protein
MSARCDANRCASRDRLKLHLRLCGDCREVERQLGQIDRLSAGLFSRLLDADGRDDDKSQR